MPKAPARAERMFSSGSLYPRRLFCSNLTYGLLAILAISVKQYSLVCLHRFLTINNSRSDVKLNYRHFSKSSVCYDRRTPVQNSVFLFFVLHPYSARVRQLTLRKTDGKSMMFGRENVI